MNCSDPQSKTGKVLLVDDDAAHRSMLRALLEDSGVCVEEARNGEEAIAKLGQQSIKLMLLDMRMPVLDGIATLEALKARGISVPTIVLSAHAEFADAVHAMKLGARDYLRKPIDLTDLRALVAKYLGDARKRHEDYPPLPPSMVFESPLMQDVLRELAMIAASDAAVLLRGETGSGKEVLAELLHRWSPRQAAPLVAVNVAALPESLIESELFGHEKGAFTGAVKTTRGRFEEADAGTLFLDEIGEMPLALQPKLLRVLQSKRIARLGASTERQIDFRLVSATHRDLETEILAGSFRQDLYYRLAVITIEIPPLRERPEDILALARRFLNPQHDPVVSTEKKHLAESSEALLLSYAWPGNIRELENAMRRASILSAGDVVLPEHLPPTLRGSGQNRRERTRRAKPSSNTDVDSASLADTEKRAILETLALCDGNRSEAARRLGISRRKLLYRLRDYEAQDNSGSS